MKIVNSITMLSDPLKSQQPSEIDPSKADNENTAPSAVSGESSSSPKDDTPLELPQPPIPQENNQGKHCQKLAVVCFKSGLNGDRVGFHVHETVGFFISGPECVVVVVCALYGRVMMRQIIVVVFDLWERKMKMTMIQEDDDDRGYDQFIK
ncbi:hypothetical protein Tco_0278165 [Tanacetum coccineum]